MVLAGYGPAELTDAELVQRFIRARDESAFEALVRKHGPMVLGVGRRVLHNETDAEDAFQATFLLLLRKAGQLRSPGRIGNWLYGVAYRTALEARKAARKRRAKEAAVAVRPEIHEDTWTDVRPVLDQELSCLPDRYRGVIVLCDLEGKSRKEAARLLGCPEGTVASRLARGRTLLAQRLTRLGLILSGGALAVVLAEKATACVPTSLVTSTVQAASSVAAGQTGLAGVLSANVVGLMEGVVRTMFLAKLKIASGLLLAVGVLGIGTAAVTYQAGAAAHTDPNQVATPARVKHLVEQLDSPRFSERQAAAEALRQIGAPALPALREAAQGTKGLEVRRRAEDLADRIMDDRVNQTQKEAAAQEVVIAKEYKKLADILEQAAALQRQRWQPDRSKAPPWNVPALVDAYVRLARARTKTAEYVRAAKAYQEAEKYYDPQDERRKQQLTEEYGGIVLHLMPVWEATVRAELAADPALKALAAKYPLAVLHSRRYARGGYLQSAYGFIYETADEQKHYNDAQLLFDNSSGSRTFQINIVTNQRNTVVDLGSVDFQADPPLTRAAPFDRRQLLEHPAVKGHVYLEKVEDTNGNRFFVLFKIVAIEEDNRYMAFLWRRLPGGKIVRQ
jgi:RNA polymerase sigma factor (sigma-70 family)